jgi:hypothetical protein
VGLAVNIDVTKAHADRYLARECADFCQIGSEQTDAHPMNEVVSWSQHPGANDYLTRRELRRRNVKFSGLSGRFAHIKIDSVDRRWGRAEILNLKFDVMRNDGARPLLGFYIHKADLNSDIRSKLKSSSLSGDLVSLPTLPDRDDQSEQSDSTDGKGYRRPEHGPVRPICRVSSGACGIPLGAKIGLVVVLTVGAWGLIFASFGLLGLRIRNRREGAIYVLGGVGLIGLSAVIWGGGGS